MDSRADSPAKPRSGRGRGRSSGRPRRLLEALVATVAFLAFIQWLLDFSLVDPNYWAQVIRYDVVAVRLGPLTLPVWVNVGGPLIRGLTGTLFFMAVTIPISVVIGFFWGWAKLAGFRVSGWPVTLLVEVFRGTPQVVLIIFAFLFGVAFIPRNANPFGTAILIAAVALALHSAAYQAEIFRAGFQSVPKGQIEAAHSMGLGPGRTMGLVVLPQAIRLSLPPLSNELATLIKDLSLLGLVAGVELYIVGQEFAARVPSQGVFPDWVFAIWITIAAIYFLVTLAVTKTLRVVEDRFRVPGLEESG